MLRLLFYFTFLLPINALADEIVVSIKPLHSLVQAVLGETATAQLLIDKADSPHGYAIKPSQVRAVHNADMVFYIHDDFEQFLPPLLANTENVSAVAVATVHGIRLLPVRTNAIKGKHDDDHDYDDHRRGHDDDDHGHGDHKRGHDDDDHDDDDHRRDHDDDDHGHGDHKRGHDDDDHDDDDHKRGHDDDDHGHDDHKRGHDDDDHGHDDHRRGHDDDDHGHDYHKRGHDDDDHDDDYHKRGHDDDDHDDDDHRRGHDDDDHDDDHRRGHDDDDHDHDDHRRGHDDDDHGHDDHGHKHGSDDLHIWLDIDNAVQIVNHIAERLSEQYPENRSDYRENAQAYIKQLTALDQSLAEEFAAMSQTPYVVLHDAYQYVERRYRLQPATAILISPHIPPSARRLRKIHRHIETHNIECIFSEPQFSDKVVAAVAGGTYRTAELDPLGAFLKPGQDLYPQLMRQLAMAMQTCLVG